MDLTCRPTVTVFSFDDDRESETNCTSQMNSVVLGKRPRSPPRQVAPPPAEEPAAAQEEFDAEDAPELQAEQAQHAPEPIPADIGPEGDEVIDPMPGQPYSLPRSARYDMQTLYARVVHGEAGPAALYADENRNFIKTTGTKKNRRVWAVFNDMLWHEVTFAVFRKSATEHAEEQALLVLAYVNAQLEHFTVRYGMERHKNPAFKAWNACKGTLTAALKHMGTERGRTSIGNLAFDALFVRDFEDSLNREPHLLSFQNGVLNLLSDDFVLTPHTPAHRMTYALPYDFDLDADMRPIIKFVNNMFPDDPETRDAVHTQSGLCITGDTTVKALWQVVSQPGTGKTTWKNILCNAMGKYASRGVPPEELTARHKFQDGFARELRDVLPPRLLCIDEFTADDEFNEGFVNQIADGGREKTVRFSIKHDDSVGVAPGKLHAHLMLFSNHALKFRIGADGTRVRMRGYGLYTVFVDPHTYDPETALPNHAPADYALIDFLESPEAWPGIMLWLVHGARRFYCKKPLSSKRMDDATFDLMIRGDPLLEWLSIKYTPTGDSGDRVSVEELAAQFRADKHAPQYDRLAYRGLDALLSFMNAYIYKSKWTDSFGKEAIGYAGLRRRVHGDRAWVAAREEATKVACEERKKAAHETAVRRRDAIGAPGAIVRQVSEGTLGLM